ncbi:hypothetical protein MA20_05100 [Bradyrhizobium japonicum]|uniref:Uncharacterized protein n=1 Tax=Bradyrhizobium japonicum TaxID=375 RepID=A0A0A3Z4I0_BRAJP|nr:hypothetical protein [Bradyrhizobium japonicum]KGT80803.1 hypothetical protein MA20_05100 [Bradyrhizobium japonicum]
MTAGTDTIAMTASMKATYWVGNKSAAGFTVNIGNGGTIDVLVASARLRIGGQTGRPCVPVNLS